MSRKKRVKHPGCSDVKVKEIIKNLRTIEGRGYNISRVFNTWLDFMITITSINFDLFHEIEKQKVSIDDKIKNLLKEFRVEEQSFVLQVFWEMFHLLGEAMEITESDVLGEIYMTEVSSNLNGQFFTPASISKLLSELTTTKDTTDNQKVSDPACGSGSTLLEAAKCNPRRFFVGQDIDLTCVKMCALNLCLNSLRGEVIWGDTLAMECNRVYQIRKSIFGVCYIHEINP